MFPSESVQCCASAAHPLHDNIVAVAMGMYLLEVETFQNLNARRKLRNLNLRRCSLSLSASGSLGVRARNKGAF